jgi:hypothetical protein
VGGLHITTGVGFGAPLSGQEVHQISVGHPLRLAACRRKGVRYLSSGGEPQRETPRGRLGGTGPVSPEAAASFGKDVSRGSRLDLTRTVLV